MESKLSFNEAFFSSNSFIFLAWSPDIFDRPLKPDSVVAADFTAFAVVPDLLLDVDCLSAIEG